MAATYTVKQVAEILGYSTNSIYSFLKGNRIKGVRVGKGRFRIPQSELNRLLLISKGQTAPVKEAGEMVPMTGTIMTPDNGMIPQHVSPSVFSLSFFGGTHTVTASIFDWFLGISSIVAGVALYLFNQSFDVVGSQSILIVMPFARILLIGGGIGILLTNFFYRTQKTWHRIFHGLLGVAGILMTVALIVMQDYDAVAIYGTLTLVIILTIFLQLGRIIPFVLYITLLPVAAVIAVCLAPGDVHVAALIGTLHLTPFITGIGLSFLCFGFILSLWTGVYRKKALFWVSSYSAAITYFVLAFWFAHDQLWSRAFFFMIVALTCMYLPSWEDLCLSRNKKAHTLAVGVFAAIVTFILIGITVVHLTQLNVISTVKRENIQKVDYARVAMESDVQSVKSAVTTSAINASLITAVEKNDVAALTDISRIIYESSNSIRRIITLDKNGQVLSTYPLGEIVQSDLSFRDYFIQARDTNNLYVSDIFETAIDNSHRKVVAVSIPLTGADKQFAGVLVASLDLNAISARLQKIAVVDRGEHIIVLDSRGKRIMHPDSSLIGIDTDQNDPTRLALEGKTGIAEGVNFNGIPSLVVYTPMESLHWAIALKAPYNNIYKLSNTANILVISFLIGCIMIIALIFQLQYIYKYKPVSDGGSP